MLTAIIERERPDALLPTMGGQTALNLATALAEQGVLAELGVELIGATAEAIRTAENRDRFKAAMREIGLEVPPSGIAVAPLAIEAAGRQRRDVHRGLEEAVRIAEEVGFPVIVRPSFILGGRGTGIAHSPEEFARLALAGLVRQPRRARSSSSGPSPAGRSTSSR